MSFPRRVRTWRRGLYWLPAVVGMVVIFIGSTGLMAHSRTSRIIGPLLRWWFPGIAEETVERVVFAVRKVAHAGEYGLLAVLVWVGLTGTFRLLATPWCWKRAGRTLGICALYAVSDEVHQAFVPSRFGNPWDVLLDTAGAALALAVLGGLGVGRRCRAAARRSASAASPEVRAALNPPGAPP